MVQIIKEGRLPSKKKYRATCGNCGTEFEFLAEEAELTYSQKDGDSLSINCPLPGCTKKVWVDMNSNRRY